MSGVSAPDELLAWADAVMSGAIALPAGLWQHTAALLARQALGQSLDRLWKARAPGLEDRPARFQLLCLPSFLEDADLAGRASHVWWSLTNACHHHPYNLAPTAAELRGWLGTVGEVVAALEAAS